MHWIEMEGVKLPKRLGGHAALDFCNTWAGWGEKSDADDDKREWLRDYDVLATWSRYADLVDDAQLAGLREQAARQPQKAAEVLVRARRLRTLVHDAVTDPTDPAVLSTLGVEIRRAGAVVELVPGPAGRVRWSLTGRAGLDLPVLAVAWSAAGLLTSAEVTKVGACPGVDCGWLFLDTRGGAAGATWQRAATGRR
ncbi:ABATE domain-containing protein [Nocardioides mesophilus]|uniref:ABATE domain-containing protein n=1 Tax=Nocardioides mesophilus TaxID=433659 RepID=UPI001CB711F1|nr:ABATE domain-containing protein [Nocardioides mesophilus]